jgi:hypothetical protein
MEHTECAFWQLTRLTKLNCWHRAEYDSDAPCGSSIPAKARALRYVRRHLGCEGPLAPFLLKPSYGEETLWSRPVQYVDLAQVRMRGAGLLKRFFFKHLAFAWQREFRLAIALTGAEEFGVAVPARGIAAPVNLGELIDHIILGPEIAASERRRVERLARGGLRRPPAVFEPAR